MNSEQLRDLRTLYPAGSRVQLDQMDDIQAPPVGAFGTVTGVDDAGHIKVSWDTGGSLSLIYGVDKFHKV